LKQTRSL